jgi:hypothetical protein
MARTVRENGDECRDGPGLTEESILAPNEKAERDAEFFVTVMLTFLLGEMKDRVATTHRIERNASSMMKLLRACCIPWSMFRMSHTALAIGSQFDRCKRSGSIRPRRSKGISTKHDFFPKKHFSRKTMTSILVSPYERETSGGIGNHSPVNPSQSH